MATGPENVLAGALRWPDYRSKDWPNAIKIAHHKTGATVWHPLQDDDGTLFYQEAEAVLSKLPRRGVPMILRELKSRNRVAYKPFSYSGFEKIVQQMRTAIGDLPSYFTLDACRHGGMTELEEAALTEGQGANIDRTSIQNEGQNDVQKEVFEPKATNAK